MTRGVYLGDSGSIQVERSSTNTPLSSLLDPGDVNVSRKRFSFDFDPSALITGDDIEIRTEDGSPLELVDGHAFPDWRGHIHIDDAGGVRLFNNFEDALNGEESSALALIAPTTAQPILVRTRGSRFRYLARVESYEFTTNREAVDLTGIGEEFRRNYASGLISGQGSVNCFWDYDREICDLPDCKDSVELAHYFAQLVLRVQQGASFAAKLNIVSTSDRAVWWDCPICIVTGVGMSFVSSQVLSARIDFVTSGPLRLHIGDPPAYLLQESSDALLKEDGDLIELEDD